MIEPFGTVSTQRVSTRTKSYAVGLCTLCVCVCVHSFNANKSLNYAIICTNLIFPQSYTLHADPVVIYQALRFSYPHKILVRFHPPSPPPPCRAYLNAFLERFFPIVSHWCIHQPLYCGDIIPPTKQIQISTSLFRFSMPVIFHYA